MPSPRSSSTGLSRPGGQPARSGSCSRLPATAGLRLLVARINRALVTESYRAGTGWALADSDYAEAEPDGSAPGRPPTGCAAVLRGAGRRDLTRGAGARPARGRAQLAPAQRQFRLRAGHRGQRRGGHRRRAPEREPAGLRDRPPLRLPRPHDLSSLADFGDSRIADDLADWRRTSATQVLARRLARLRPELDLYLMTEFDGRGDGRASQPSFPPGLPRPGRLAGAASEHPRRGGGAVPHAVLRSAAALQPPPDGCVPRAADLAGQLNRQLALDQRHGRLLRPGHLPGRDVGHRRRPRLAARTDRSVAPGAATGGRDVRRPADVLRHERHVHRQQDRRAGPRRPRRHRAGRP